MIFKEMILNYKKITSLNIKNHKKRNLKNKNKNYKLLNLYMTSNNKVNKRQI